MVSIIVGYATFACSLWYRDYFPFVEEFWMVDIRSVWYSLNGRLGAQGSWVVTDLPLVPFSFVLHFLNLEPLEVIQWLQTLKYGAALLSAYAMFRIQGIAPLPALSGTLIAGSTVRAIMSLGGSTGAYQMMAVCLSFVAIVLVSRSWRSHRRTHQLLTIVLLQLALVLVWVETLFNWTTAFAALGIVPVAWLYVKRCAGADTRSAVAGTAFVGMSIVTAFLVTLPGQILMWRANTRLLDVFSQGALFASTEVRLALVLQPGRGAWWDAAGAVFMVSDHNHPVVVVLRLMTWMLPLAVLLLSLSPRAMVSVTDSPSYRATRLWVVAAATFFLLTSGATLIPFYDQSRLWGVPIFAAFREPWSKFSWLFVVCVSMALMHSLRIAGLRWGRATDAGLSRGVLAGAVVLALVPLSPHMAVPDPLPDGTSTVLTASELRSLNELSVFLQSVNSGVPICPDPVTFGMGKGLLFQRALRAFAGRPLYPTEGASAIAPDGTSRQLDTCAAMKQIIPEATTVLRIELLPSDTSATSRGGCPHPFQCTEIRLEP